MHLFSLPAQGLSAALLYASTISAAPIAECVDRETSTFMGELKQVLGIDDQTVSPRHTASTLSSAHALQAPDDEFNLSIGITWPLANATGEKEDSEVAACSAPLCTGCCHLVWADKLSSEPTCIDFEDPFVATFITHLPWRLEYFDESGCEGSVVDSASSCKYESQSIPTPRKSVQWFTVTDDECS